MTKAFIAGVLMATIAFAYAQEPTFQTRVPLVVIPVTVADKQGRTIDGLSDSDFLLSDNNRLTAVHVDPAGVYDVKISLVIVLQTADISTPALLKIRKVASLLEGYVTGEGGETAVVSANDEVRVLQSFTTDNDRIHTTFQKLKTGEGSKGRTVDGIQQALNLLAARPKERRRLIFVLSESRDRGSESKASDVLTRAQQENVTIHTLTYSAYFTAFTTKASELAPAPGTGSAGNSLGTVSSVNGARSNSGGGGIPILAIAMEIARLAKINIGETMATYTGGRHVSFATVHRLEEDIASIGKEIHSQYMVSFQPPEETASTFHTLTLSIKDHPSATIRARPGYWNLITEK